MTTSTGSIGTVDDATTNISSTTTTAYYDAGGHRFARSVTGIVSYLASDGLASVLLALDGRRQRSGPATLCALCGHPLQQRDDADQLQLHRTAPGCGLCCYTCFAGCTRESPRPSRGDSDKVHLLHAYAE